jgi:hypothetical protein
LIDPQLDDWWSHKRLTELSYRDSQVRGAGVPLKVILPIFLDVNLIWFSRIYGNYDDNIVLLAFDRTTAESFEKVKHDAISPVQVVYDGDFPDEYLLTERVCSNLGMSFDGNGYSIARESVITYHVYIHDNCFFFMKPADELVLQGLVKNVLSQHSFYLEQQVDWSEVVEEVKTALTSSGEIQLQSHPKERLTLLRQFRGSARLGKEFRLVRILIEDRKARPSR